MMQFEKVQLGSSIEWLKIGTLVLYTPPESFDKDIIPMTAVIVDPYPKWITGRQQCLTMDALW